MPDDALAPYDEAYFRARYRPDEPPNAYARAVAGALVRRYRPQRSLDIGAGVGILLRAFEELGVDAWGVEGARAAIEMSPARERLRQVDLVQDVFPFPDGSFDLATCVEVAEHVPVGDAWARETARVVKPGGVLFLQTPNPWSIAAKMDPTHVNVRSKFAWMRLLRRHGFEPLHRDLLAVERELPVGHYGSKLPRALRFSPLVQWPVVLTGTRTLFRRRA